MINMNNSIGIYIHIPFCMQKCKYCDFNSYSGIGDMSSSYIQAVIREICAAENKYEADTIYIGGGTPTYLDAKQISQVVDAVRGRFKLSPGCEITIECNPGTADYEKLRILKNCGINRLSIGLQSDNDEILKTLGRIHTYSEFKTCLSAAQKAGFDNISADLMFGLPNQTTDIWRATLNRVAALPLSHISAYSLKIEKGTPFYTMYHSGILKVPGDDVNRIMYDDCTELLAQHGYERYEISNFANNKKYSRHNLKYWTGGDYIGFGAGACSRLANTRKSNIRGVREYINAINNTGTAADLTETIVNTELDTMIEYVFLALRLTAGMNKSEFKNKFGMDVYDVFGEPLGRHLNITKTIEDCGGHIRIKPEYIYVSNNIMSDFII